MVVCDFDVIARGGELHGRVGIIANGPGLPERTADVGAVDSGSERVPGFGAGAFTQTPEGDRFKLTNGVEPGELISFDAGCIPDVRDVVPGAITEHAEKVFVSVES